MANAGSNRPGLLVRSREVVNWSLTPKQRTSRRVGMVSRSAHPQVSPQAAGSVGGLFSLGCFRLEEHGFQHCVGVSVGGEIECYVSAGIGSVSVANAFQRASVVLVNRQRVCGYAGAGTDHSLDGAGLSGRPYSLFIGLQRCAKAIERLAALQCEQAGWERGVKWRLANVDAPEISVPSCAEEFRLSLAAQPSQCRSALVEITFFSRLTPLRSCEETDRRSLHLPVSAVFSCDAKR
jgi:hypothetical protein